MSGARFREVFRYELGYRVRSGSTWLCAFFLLFMAFWGTAGPTDGSPTDHVNAPQKLAATLVLFGGLFGLLVSATLFGDAATRDAAAGMDPLVYTTRVEKTEYLGGRFLAALLTNMVVAVALPLGHLLAVTIPRVRDAVEIGPIRLLAYVQPLAFYVWPNLVLVGAILFAIGTFARHIVPVFLGAIGVFIGYLTAANYWEQIDNPVLAGLADPFGINAVIAAGRFLTPSERNVQLIGLPGIMAANRLIWLAVAATVLFILHRTFRFAHAGGARRLRRGARATEPLASDAAAVRQAPVTTHLVARVSGAFTARTRVRQTLAVARRSFGDVMAGVAFRIVLVGFVGMVLLMGWNVTDTVFETATWPVTQLVAGSVIAQRIAIFPWIVVILYAGELVWKDRDVGASEIADAMPVPEGVALLGRFLALSAMIVLTQLAFVAGGILMQTLQRYTHYELGVYAGVIALTTADLVLIAALVMAVHVLVNQKYVGHFVAVLAVIAPRVAPGFGIRHRMLLYGTDPGWTYSDMNGFGPFIVPIVWFKLYWAAWALLLGVLGALFVVRGRETGWGRRLTLARARMAGPLARTAALGTVLVVTLGGFVFYNTNVLNDYQTRDELGAPQAAYEKRYARFERTPQPTITEATLRVELHPDAQDAELHGTYRLVNRTGASIDSVHVSLDPRVEAGTFSLDRASKPVLVDTALGYRILAFDRPLAPGDSVQLTFDVAMRQHGFSNARRPTDVAGNGTYFGRQLLPFVGYQRFLALSDDATRARFGLAKRPPLPGPDDAEARQHREMTRNDAERMHVVTTIGTAGDQTAVTTGTLRRQWTESGRRYFTYESDGAGSFGVPIVSARYAVLEDRWEPARPGTHPGVPLQIYYHPAHREHIGSMMRGMKASLDYYTRELGPYQFPELRIVEVPPYTIFGRAHRGMIAFSEAAFFSRSEPGDMDQAFYGTAHETGHMFQVSGSVARGIGFLGESFANYGAVMVTEATLGPALARRAYDAHMERYLTGRSTQSREVPVLDVSDQTYIMYRKGPVALLTMRDFLGADAVNGALRRYLARWRDVGPPYATALDQYAELRAVTPDSLMSLLTDLFETVTLWDVAAERASVRQAGGAYEVTLDVTARKVRADSTGVETETPMNDLVEIGVFAAGDEAGLREPLYLRRHRIHTGKQTITVTVPRRPARAGVDPYHKLIDRDRDDHVVDVDVVGAPSRPTAP